MDKDCIFCKMIKGEIPTNKLYEDDKVIVIKDINPIAPIHLLMIVKEHYAYLSNQNINQAHILGECLNKIGKLQHQLGLDNGYRVIINQGDDGGQSVKHLHIHILGGKALIWEKL